MFCGTLKCVDLVAEGKPGAPEKDTVLIRMRVSRHLYAYLTWLKDNTMRGASENDVALQLLTNRLIEMKDGNYREGSLPPSNGK